MPNIQITQFDKTAGYNVSQRYVPINTAALVAQFEAAGYALTSTSAARVRNAARQGYQKHVFRFRHADLTLRGVQDSIPEVVVQNAYDGTSSLRVMLGVYRIVCANGLIVGSTIQSFRVRHVGANALRDALNAAQSVRDNATEVADSILSMQGRILSDAEALSYAAEAASLIKPESSIQVDVTSLLRARRNEDVGMDMWSVFNRVQENIVRGGLVYTAADAKGRVRIRTRRAIRAIDANVSVNMALWDLALNLK